MRGLKDKLLAAPVVYDSYQWLIGAPGCHSKFILEMVSPKSGERVLDVGCGVGASLRFMPEGVTYVGIDVSLPYIEVARAKYGQRGTFICADISMQDSMSLGIFDRAFSFGVLHHLSDTEVMRTADLIKRVVKSGGTFSTLDPCYVIGQPTLAKFLIDNDRGRYVRDQVGFERLLSRLGTLQSHVFHDLLRIPYTQIAMEITLGSHAA
jgi:SAM-dependent methyltransferase